MANAVCWCCLKSRAELARCCKATGSIACFEYQHALAGFGQVGGAGKAIVASADNDGIVLGQFLLVLSRLSPGATVDNAVSRDFRAYTPMNGCSIDARLATLKP